MTEREMWLALSKGFNHYCMGRYGQPPRTMTLHFGGGDQMTINLCPIEYCEEPAPTPLREAGKPLPPLPPGAKYETMRPRPKPGDAPPADEGSPA